MNETEASPKLEDFPFEEEAAAAAEW